MFFLCQKSVIIPFFPPSCFPITMIIIMLAWKSRKSNLSAGRRFDFFITIIYFITSSSTQFLHHPHPDISHHHHNPYPHPQFLPENNEISHLSAVGSNFLRQLVRTVVDCHSIKRTAGFFYYYSLYFFDLIKWSAGICLLLYLFMIFHSIKRTTGVLL